MDKSELADPDAVLKGIAYEAKEDRIFVSGKLWPKLFEIEVVHQGHQLRALYPKPKGLFSSHPDSKFAP